MMRGKMKRKLLLIILIATLVLISISCVKGTDKSLESDSKITIGIDEGPMLFNMEASGAAAQLMFLPLAYSELEPALAERWEHSEDYKEWTFYLRKDVKWHDGTQTTAHDVKFTIDLLNHPDVDDWRFEDTSVEVIDDFSLIFKYKEPKIYQWYQTFYPQHILKEFAPKEFWTWDFWTKPIGNGPFRFVRYVPEIMAEVEVNPDFYRGKPKIDRVVFKFIKQQSLAELLSGNVDVLEWVPRDFLLKLPKTHNFCSYHSWNRAFVYIYWNHKNPLFEDVDVRKALTMAINREELAVVLNYPEGVPLMDTVVTPSLYKKLEFPDPIPFDLEEAQNLLESAGWSDSNGDGVRDRDGHKFQFAAIVFGSVDYRIPVYIQSQFLKIGIKMDIQNLITKLGRARIDASEFEAAIFLTSTSATNPFSGHLKMFGKDAPSGYMNPEISQLLEVAAKTVDIKEKDKLYRKIQQIMVQDLPCTFLLPFASTSIVNCRIKGLKSPGRSSVIGNLNSLWIEE
jgi:peptide/nickel transport system substrate-binding protein